MTNLIIGINGKEEKRKVSILTVKRNSCVVVVVVKKQIYV